MRLIGRSDRRHWPTPGPSRKREGGKGHRPPRHFIPGPPAQHIGQRRFPRAVRPHDRMDLARINSERKALEDRLVSDRGGKVIDFEH